MKKKYFLYLALAILVGCNSGGPSSLAPNVSQSVNMAFTKMMADKEFSKQGNTTFSEGNGTTFSEDSGTQFKFADQSGVTFAGGSCNIVESDVKIDGVAASFTPATCRLEKVYARDQNGNYVEYGYFYFIYARN